MGDDFVYGFPFVDVANGGSVSGTALVIEPDKGKETLTDGEIEQLFRKK